MGTHRGIAIGWLAASLAFVGGPVLAADPPELDRHARAVDQAATSAGQQHVAERLAAELNASWGRTPAPYTAESLTAQRAQNGWGWGGVLIGNRLAQHVAESRLAANPTLTPEEALAQSLGQVTAARQAHTGWGVIAQENGVKLGTLVSSVRHSTEAVATGAKGTGGVTGKSVGKGADKAAKGTALGGKSDKAPAGGRDFANSFDSAGRQATGVAVSGPGTAGGAGRGGSDRGSSDKGGGHGAEGRGGGEGHGGGHGGGGGGGKGK